MYREHWPLVCGFLLRRTRDPHLAEDLAQETFIKATRALLGWRGENAAGLAYGYVDQLSSVRELRELLKDPRVRTIRLAGVTFDLDRPRP
ncbi:sigma factor [Nonomuraea angiospora]|uniref:RNA polymerase sigma factor n=1 Tax=Nonomuraea angiospora TaxID=46172 RepID=UPI0033E0BAA6